MYFIGIRNDISPCGNGGTLHFTCGIADMRRFAEGWAKEYKNDEVWLIHDCQYTQNVCEMSVQKFTEYVRRIGIPMYIKEGRER